MQRGAAQDAARRWLRLHLAHGIGEHPQRAVEFHVLVDSGDGPGGHGATTARAPVQTASGQVFLNLCGDAAYVEQFNRSCIGREFLALRLHITFRFALALRSLIHIKR